MAERRFEDRCRQLSRHTGPNPERKAILDSCLADASRISADYSELESCANKLLAVMQAQDHRDDRFMSTVAEALSYHQSDKAMADDFSLCILSKQIGQNRRPMKRPVVNPLEDLMEDDDIEEETEEVINETPEEPEPVTDEEVPEEEDPVEETGSPAEEEKPEEEAED